MAIINDQGIGCGRLTVLLMQVCQHHESIQWVITPIYQYVYINSRCSLSILSEPLDTTKSWCWSWLRKFGRIGRSHGKNCSKQLGHICTGDLHKVDHIIESVDSMSCRGLSSRHAANTTRGVHRTHTPRWTSTGQDACSAATIDVTSDAHRTGRLSRILCSCMAISKVWEWPLTVYTTYYIVKLERWGQMLRIIGNSWKNSQNNSHDVCEVHRSWENTVS